VAKVNLVEARSSSKSLDSRGGETAIQGGGRGKGKGKEETPRLGYQVNNKNSVQKGRGEKGVAGGSC
jgi:hypothetical protein